MPDNKKEQEREELHRAIWAIADDLRGSVDGWDFKSYVLGIMFYRYISENLTNYINADEIAARVEKAFVDLPKGKKNKVQKDIYTGGFATIPAQQQSLFYFGFDISGIRNADLAVLIKLLNGRLERSFIGTDVLSDVRIAGYYGRRTLQISIKTQQKNIGEILDTCLLYTSPSPRDA